MYCAQCGTENPAGAQYCKTCGTALPTNMAPDQGLTQNNNATEPAINADSAPNPAIAQPEQEQAAAPSAAAEGHATSSDPLSSGEAAKKGLNGKLIAVIAGVAAIAIVAGIGLFSVLGASNGKADFENAFRQSHIVAEGVLGNNYVKESPYEVTDIAVGDVSKNGDTETSMITATIENEYYTTDLIAQGIHYKNGSQDLGYEFYVDKSTSRPKRGIALDEQNKLQDLNPPLGEDGMSCTVEKTAEDATWFADTSTTTEYKYVFDEDSGWQPDGTADPQHSITYHDIDGEYKAKTGNLTEFTKFTIHDLDPAKGTFTIDYTVNVVDLVGKVVGEFSGSLSSTIDPRAPFGDTLEYYFEGGGNSTGGDGQASIRGVFTTSSSGEKTIEIHELRVDYTHVSAPLAAWGGEEVVDSYYKMYTGKMFKQE